MNQIKYIFTKILVVFYCIVSGCMANTIPDSLKLSKPGILLTFDDRFIFNWEKQLPLFEKYGARVTFFVDRFDQLTPQQLHALQKIKQAGHAIGCHGFRHLKAAEYCTDHSTDEYMSTEILPAIAAMQNYGFDPVCFAYPSSNRDESIDQALFEKFRYVRTGYSTPGVKFKDNEKLFTKPGDLSPHRVLYGKSCHPHDVNDDLFIQTREALDRVKQQGEIIVLYAHDIREKNTPGPRHYISIKALEKILEYADSLGLLFYTFEDLPE